MAKLDAEKIYGPAEAGDPVLVQQQLNSAVLGAVLIDMLPDTEAPQAAFDQYPAPAPAPVTPLQIGAPRAIEAVRDSAYAKPDTEFLPIA